MSYPQGGSASGNGSWHNPVPPNPQRMPSINSQHLQPRAPPPYQTPVQQPHHWTPPVGPTNNGYISPASLQQQAQQYQHHNQYISPAQLFSQPSLQARPAQFQRTPSLTRRPSLPSFQNSANMASLPPVLADSDTANVLISLAEEYFEAAHKLAPTVGRAMTATHVETYEQLIATGLGCLETALKRVKLVPRTEAVIRLRYAGVLLEETENAMEAETALSQGIALCERNHYYDLKHTMQFMLAQFTAKKNLKAAMKAVDSHIDETETYQHIPWVYAFRFMRASLALAAGTTVDNRAAIQNFQAIAKLSELQNDGPIHFAASLLEAMAHLKSAGSDSLEHAQRALAAAWGHQMDPDCKIPQLQGLTHMMDLVCSIKQGNVYLMKEKLKTMRSTLDAIRAKTDGWTEWSFTSDVTVIPIKRTAKSSHIVSPDTKIILAIGDHGGDDLMLSFLNLRDAYALSFLLAGFVCQRGAAVKERIPALKYLKEGLTILESEDIRTSSILPDILARRAWRGQILCYTRIYVAFYHASLADWESLAKLLDELKNTAQKYEISSASAPGCFILYLTGVYHQGIGDLETALAIFSDQRFALNPSRKIISSVEELEQDIALLAALNALWIVQHPRLRSISRNADMVEKLAPFCETHPCGDIRSVYSLVLATVKTQADEQIIQFKENLNRSLKLAQTTKNFQIMSITLSLMSSSFFGNVMGPQGEKSAQAATIQSLSAGDPLWTSVSEGLLAHHYELHERTAEAQKSLVKAHIAARKMASNFASSS